MPQAPVHRETHQHWRMSGRRPFSSSWGCARPRAGRWARARRRSPQHRCAGAHAPSRPRTLLRLRLSAQVLLARPLPGFPRRSPSSSCSRARLFRDSAPTVRPAVVKKRNGSRFQPATSSGIAVRPDFRSRLESTESHSRSTLAWCSQKIGSTGANSSLMKPGPPPTALWMLLCGPLSSVSWMARWWWFSEGVLPKSSKRFGASAAVTRSGPTSVFAQSGSSGASRVGPRASSRAEK